MNKRYQQGFMVFRLIKFVIFLVIILFVLDRCSWTGLLNNKLKQSATPDPKITGIVIGFFNGVNVTFEDASAHLDNIKTRYGEQTTSSNTPIQYQLFYNDTYGLAADMLETFNQRNLLIQMEQAPELFWNPGLIGKNQLKEILMNHPENQGLAQTIENNIVGLSNKFLLQSIAKNNFETDKEQRQIISDILMRNKHQKFVFLAHSQGNLFGVQAYKYTALIGGRVSIVHAAPPNDILKGDYILSNEDLVIDSVRQFGRVKPANVDLTGCGDDNCPDITGHGFGEIYFNYRNAAGQRTHRLMLDLLNN